MRPRPTPLRDPLRVLVLARTAERGAGLAARIAALGNDALGPLHDDALAREAEAALAPDLCLIELPLETAAVLLVAIEVADRRESRGLSVRLVEPVTDEQLASALELALDRAAELRAIERQATSVRAVMRDVDAVVRAKAVLADRLAMCEQHASRRLRASARRRGERLADTARRVAEPRAGGGDRGRRDRSLVG